MVNPVLLLLKPVGVLLHLPITTSSTSLRLLRALLTTIPMHILALTNKVTKCPMMLEHLTEHLHLDLLNNLVASTALLRQAHHHLASTADTTNSSNINSTAMVKALRQDMTKDTRRDTTKVTE